MALRRFLYFLLISIRILLVGGILVGLVSQSTPPPGDFVERVRTYTRQVEFDYVTWTADALFVRLNQSALGARRFLPSGQERDLVNEYLGLVAQHNELEDQIARVYADPQEKNPEAAAGAQLSDLEAVTQRLNQITPLVEALLQEQVSTILAELDLTAGGQPVPPVWYHSTPLPQALIVSPRHRIQTDANVSLDANLNLDQVVRLEEEVGDTLDVSALVVPVGGIGIYPTMVMRSNNLNWLTEVISHEWIHNFLTLRPLGLNYDVSPQLRTMNETAAAIAGEEIGSLVIQRYYPEMAPAPPSDNPQPPAPETEPDLGFDFNREMHRVRVEVDRLLAEGKIQEAEQFMEDSRQLFLDNGYLVRKLNQAYFAFYGAYADEPGGAAGDDPVGPAVRALRQQSVSLAQFLQVISGMTTFAELREAVED